MFTEYLIEQELLNKEEASETTQQILNQLCKDLVTLKEEIEIDEENLKAKKEKAKYLEEVTIAGLMDDNDLQQIKTSDMQITRKDTYKCSITKSTSESAFKFLTDSGNEGILKRNLTIDINAFPDIINLLKENNVIYDKSISAHHATLSKVIGQLVSEGKLSTEDFELFNIYLKKEVKIKEIK